MQRSPLIFSGLLALTGVLHGAQAAELGDAVVRSWLGQPMIADIELLPDEGGAVQAFLAHADVYRGANVALPPVLATAHFSVMRRDGRQFLHVTSIKPVDTAPVHLFLELVENGKHTVREVTLWFKPDPHPPAPAVAANAAEAGASSASTAASPAAAAARVPVPGTSGAGAPSHGGPGPAAVTVSGAVAAGQPLTSNPTGHRAAKSAASTRAAESALACASLDYKNAQLSAQIVDLEEKVKLLQAAIDTQTGPVHKSPVVPAASLHGAAKHAAASAKGKLNGHEGKPGTNWLLYGGIAAAVATLGGTTAIVLRKRRGKGKSAAKPAPAKAGKGGLAGLIGKFKKKKADPAPQPQEPALEPEAAEN